MHSLSLSQQVWLATISANGWIEARDSNSLNGLAHRNEQEDPRSGTSGGLRVSVDNINAFLSYAYYMRSEWKNQPLIVKEIGSFMQKTKI